MSSRRLKKEVLKTNKESGNSSKAEDLEMDVKKESENPSNAEDLEIDPLKELQTMWKVPATAQFVSLYRFSFKLPEIEIEDLEDGLLQTSEVGRKVLRDLLVGLLRGIRPQGGINTDNFEEHLRKQLTKIKETGECLNATLTEEVTFSKLDVTSKVDLLYSLCLSRLDRADAQEAMKDMDAEALRVQPLGSDDLGNEYWYFYGTRLYKQEPSTEKKKDWKEEWVDQKNQSFNKRGRGRPRKTARRKSEHENEFEGEKSDRRYMNIDEKSRWSVVCNSIEDWVDFAEKFKKSKSKKEQALFVTVTDNFLPVLNEIYQEKERKLKEKLRQLIPKAVPRRMETRRMTTRRTVEVDMNGFDSANAHKEHLVRDRAHRLEERNRRANQISSERSRSRSSRRNYIDDEDEYDDDDDFESFSEDTSRNYASDELRQDLMPLISANVTDLKSKVLLVLSEVKLQKDAWPFLYPVEESYAPGYYEIIQEPMDLSTMSKKLMDNSYRTINDIDEDFEKMVSNCQLYNGEHSAMSKMVINLWKVFRKGLSKMFGSSTQDQNQYPPVNNQPSSKSQQTDSDSQDSTYGKRKADSVNKKRKKKAYHKNALETLSKEAQLAVEKSQSSEKMQVDMSMSHPKQYSMYSDLKIVPINSHPAEMIEKFSSDSSNQDDNDFDSCNDPSSPYGNQSSSSQSPTANETNNLGAEMQMKQRSAPAIHFITQSDYTSELSEIIEKTSPKAFNILQNDDINNELPNNSLNTSVSSLSSHHSSSPDVSGHSRSPQNIVHNLPQPTVSDRTVPLLAESFGINELNSFTSSYQTSTVNASALGLSSTQTGFRKPVPSNQVPMTTSFGTNSQAPFGTATYTSAQVPSNLQPLRNSPTFPTQVPVPESHQLANQQNQGVQVTKESSQYYQFQKSSTEIGFPSTSGVTFAPQVQMANVVTNSTAQIPLQVPVPYSKAFPNQSNLVLQQQEGNKFPNVKFSLPPSTGEILLVPGDQASSSMTFHLFAQPSGNPSQPIQSNIELKASNGNSNVRPLSNQQAASAVERQGISNKVTIRDESAILPQKRKSPLQDLVEPAVQPTPTTTSLPSIPKTSEPTSVFPGPVRFTNASSNFSSYANSTNAGMQPLQRPQYNPANTSISYSNQMSVLQASNMRSNAPLQQNGNMLQVPVTVQKTMPAAFPNPNKAFVSTNCNATTMNSVVSRSSNVAVKKMHFPNGAVPMNSNSIIQNANGQLVFIPSAKEPAQRPVGEVQTPKVPSSGKALPSAMTCSSFFPGANNAVMQSFAFQNAPMNQTQIYTQVVPSQLQPQFVNNNPYYIITDPNAFQNPQRYPVMNMQPISFTNR